MLKTPAHHLPVALGFCSRLVLASALALGCGDGDGTRLDGETDGLPPLETTAWLDPAPELRIVTSPDGMRLFAARSALPPGTRVHVVNTQSGESIDGTATNDGSLSLPVPGGSQDDYEVTVRKTVSVRQEAVLTLAVPSLEDGEAARGPCNCADVRFPEGNSRSIGTVYQPLECLPGVCTEPGCSPTLDAWQAELCAEPRNGAILRLEGCGLVQFNFALGSDAIGAFGNQGNPFYSFDAQSQQLAGFYRYSDTNVANCEPTPGWSTGYAVHGQALGGAGNCAEVTTCVVCGSEPGVDGPACSE